MRMKRIVLLAFLMMLYIGPSLFALSYASPAIPTEPNMDKEFSIAASWYADSSFHYRKEIFITQAVGVGGVDYQVNITVPYDSDMQTDFDDVVFTDNDKITKLDYWLESKTDSVSAKFWVEVSDYISENQPVEIYMYYGNSTVSSLSNGPATFLFFDDFDDDSFNVTLWDIYAGAVTEANGYLEITGTSSYHSDDTFTFAHAVGSRTYFKVARSITGFVNIADYWNDAIMTNSEADQFYSREDTAVTTDSYSWTTETWQIQEVHWYSSDLTKAFVNGVEVSSINTNVPSDSMNVYCYSYEPDDELLRTDWVYLRRIVVSGPAFASFGEEENNLNLAWRVFGEVEIVFFVPPDLWAWNMSLILLGLCMVPASTVYLVYGGKNDFSTDKLFYGLIMLLMGFGLIIGGIM